MTFAFGDMPSLALGVVETQLTQRYVHDYRVICLGDPDTALLTLAELSRGGRGGPGARGDVAN